ncbi:MAG: hypothetical protein IH899_01965 [Planctomycetes bacterium]|nr:hypothetical protein [Planctomycetota bacterium]
MSETFTVGFTERERKLLLQGLRFVRSSVMLEIIEPSPKVKQERTDRLSNIAALVDHINDASPANTAARV